MAGIKEEKKIYLVDLYCRLPKDDAQKRECEQYHTEIHPQDYVKGLGWHLAKTYMDDVLYDEFPKIELPKHD